MIAHGGCLSTKSEIADAKLRAARALVEWANDGRAYGLRYAETLLHWTLFFGVTIVRVLRLDQHHDSERDRSKGGGKPAPHLCRCAQHEQRRQSSLVVQGQISESPE